MGWIDGWIDKVDSKVEVLLVEYSTKVSIYLYL